MRTAIAGLAVAVSVGIAALSQSPGPSAAVVSDAVVAERQEDLRAFEASFLSVDRSYDARERASAAEKLAALRGALPRLTNAGFELAVAEIVALAANGHSNVAAARWPMRYNRVPLHFLILDDDLRIGVSPEDRGLEGAAVETISGKSLAAFREAWRRYQPGTSGWRDEFIYHFIESPEVLHAAGLGDSPDRLTLTVRLRDGQRVERTIPAVRTPPEPGFGGGPRQLAVVPQGRTSVPLYLTEPQQIVRYVELAEHDAVYIQFRRNFDPTDRAGFRSTVRDFADRVKARSPRYVIVDQRFNNGGDLNDTRDLMQAIPAAVGERGRVFAITSGRTFSAGIASVGYLKQAGGERVTLVGRPVGDELEFWAEGRFVTLPRSGIMIGYSTQRHNYQRGCNEPDCHAIMQRYPIIVPTLEPDVRPAFTWDDFAAGRDPYMSAILEMIRR